MTYPSHGDCTIPTLGQREFDYIHIYVFHNGVPDVRVNGEASGDKYFVEIAVNKPWCCKDERTNLRQTRP